VNIDDYDKEKRVQSADGCGEEWRHSTLHNHLTATFFEKRPFLGSSAALKKHSTTNPMKKKDLQIDWKVKIHVREESFVLRKSFWKFLLLRTKIGTESHCRVKIGLLWAF
jgi:hypothetical protein